MLDRTTILKGPGYIATGAATILSDGNIEATLIVETEDIGTDAYGPLGPRVIDKRIEVTITPKAWTHLGVLFPYAATQIGASIYGATDTPLTIHTLDDTLVIANAKITTLPSLNLRTRGGGTIMGAVTFTGLIANNSATNAAASYFTVGGAGLGAAIPALTLTDLRTETFTATFNGTTIKPDEGFQVNFELNLAAQVDDAVGTYDMRLASLNAVASCVPRGMTAAAMTSLLGFGSAIGAAPTFSNFVITGSGGIAITLNNCYARQGQHRAGADAHRTGTMEFRTARTQAAGSLGTLWTIA